jgi:hypothetical protein
MIGLKEAVENSYYIEIDNSNIMYDNLKTIIVDRCEEFQKEQEADAKRIRVEKEKKNFRKFERFNNDRFKRN